MRVGAALNLTPFAQSFVSLGGESPKLFGANASQSDSTKLPSRELAREEKRRAERNRVERGLGIRRGATERNADTNLNEK